MRRPSLLQPYVLLLSVRTKPNKEVNEASGEPIHACNFSAALAVAEACFADLGYRCRVKIREARTTIVGTPWRELLFLELTTDDGLVGVSEVRMVNKTE